MARWLFKEEPEHYSFADLVRDGKTTWDGVSNALARKHLQQIQAGDEVFFYHTGKEKAIVGIMKVSRGPREAATAEDPKAIVVDVEPVRALPRGVTLAAIKEDAQLSGWELIRLPRLSVVPVSEVQWQRIEQLAREAD